MQGCGPTDLVLVMKSLHMLIYSTHVVGTTRWRVFVTHKVDNVPLKEYIREEDASKNELDIK